MGETYYVYFMRSQGWVNKSGAYGTDLAQAKTFSEEEAVRWCKAHASHEGGLRAFPVPTRLALQISGAE